MMDRTSQTPQWYLRHEMGSITDISGPLSESEIHQLVREGEYRYYWVCNCQPNLCDPEYVYWYMLSEVAELIPEEILPEIDWPNTTRMNIPQ